MAQVKSKNTRPEILARKALFARGLRYRVHVSKLPGKPDIVFAKFRTAIFINGCFWHWHGCRRSRLPATNYDYWEKKIDRNVKNDQKSITSLIELGWRVLVIWECAIKKKMLDKVVIDVETFLNSDNKNSYAIIEPDGNNCPRLVLVELAA